MGQAELLTDDKKNQQGLGEEGFCDLDPLKKAPTLLWMDSGQECNFLGCKLVSELGD